MARRKKGSSSTGLIIGALILVVGLIGGLWLLKDDTEAADDSALEDTKIIGTAISSFFSGDGLWPNVDGIFGTGFLSKWF